MPAPVDDPTLQAEWDAAIATTPHARGSRWRLLRRAALAATALPKTTSGSVMLLKQARAALGQAPAAVDDDSAALVWALHPIMALYLRTWGRHGWRTTVRALSLAQPGAVGSLDARARWLDGEVWGRLQALADAGQQRPQFIALAAGYDARATRVLRAFPTAVAVEADLPPSVAAKAAVLASALPDAPRPAGVGVDLRRAEDALDAVAGAGVDFATPAVATLEGLLPYLPSPAAHRLLAALADRAAPGSAVAFDFVPVDAVAPSDDGNRRSRDRAFARVALALADIGEPLLSGFPTDAAAHAAEAARLGWRVGEVLSPAAIRERMYAGADKPPVVSPYLWFAVWVKA